MSDIVAAKNPNIPITVDRRDVSRWSLYGRIDDVRLYDEILTEQQIREIVVPAKGTLVVIR